uniref:UDP-glucose 4-epimerase n=1 Tax=Mimivirus LCMiAC02 TaxID=2506609 RepID=A0A481Z0K5_9VIRU|nr:MAG: GDP-mannose 4,6 dehydratase [Mimivirus LCMiAC02]
MSVLVTGGMGFIGSHICVELLNNNYKVIIVDNLCNSKIYVLDKIKQITKKEIIFYNYDLNDINDIDKIFSLHKINAVIHLAGLKAVSESIKKPLLYYQNNIVSTLNLIQIMEKYKCYNLIFSSSATVYGNSKPPYNETSAVGIGISNPYGRTKYMIEQILSDITKSDACGNNNNNWNIISLRYFNPIGAHKSGLIGEDPNSIPNNLMPFVLKVAIQNNTKKNLGDVYKTVKIFGNDFDTIDGTGVRDYIHVCDLAIGHIKALKKINKLHQMRSIQPGACAKSYNVFNLGTGHGSSVLQVINTFKKVNKINLPYDIVDRRKGDIATSYCVTKKSNNILDWYPIYNLNDMCRDAWNYAKHNL